eukprot:Colp12_sorted_trinity150504_noHs@33385
MAYLTVEEFNGVPQYMKGRLQREQLNDAIDELHKLIASKQQLLAMPRKHMSEQQMKKYEHHVNSCCSETEGRTFFVEEDLKSVPVQKTVLTILRHCGRLREIRGGGYTRYVVSLTAAPSA